jgi:signal transduction histidine kinase
MSELEAVSDGRSLHRRLASETGETSEPLERLTSRLNAMIARLEQSFAGLRRFTADASHELKTPLAVLRADVERALAADSNRTEQLIALEEALAETTRMADLVDSLLTLARADEGRFDLVREPVDLQNMARDVLETAHLLAEPKGITVRMSPPPALTVPGDGARLRQLLLNLITNAIKYTPNNGEVELSLEHVGNTAQFSVRDTGIGIAAADLPHVFDRFWRADRARSRVGERGGFGLGLAISQYIAQAHGGSLIAHSRLGRGSTFTVALPLVEGVTKIRME